MPSFPCCVADCKCLFVKYSAFKTHCYRHHNNPSVSELDIMQGPYTCENISCQKQYTDLKDHLAHLRSHLSKSELVNCPFAKCGKTFKVRSSFTSHISRIHKHATAGQVSATCSVELVSTEPASDVMEGGTAENVPETVDMPDDIDLRALYTKNLCMICSQHTKKQFKEVLKGRTNLCDSDVDEALSSLTDLHSSCSTTLSTGYTRKQFFQIQLCSPTTYSSSDR